MWAAPEKKNFKKMQKQAWNCLTKHPSVYDNIIRASDLMCGSVIVGASL